MARGETPITVIPGHALDHEIDLMLGSVDRARRNAWYDGDLTEAGNDRVLAAVTNRAPLDYSTGLTIEGDPGRRPSRWHEETIAGAPIRS